MQLQFFVVKRQQQRLPAPVPLARVQVGIVQHVVGILVALLAVLLAEPRPPHGHDAVALAAGVAVAHVGEAEALPQGRQPAHLFYGLEHIHDAKVYPGTGEKKDSHRLTFFSSWLM